MRDNNKSGVAKLFIPLLGVLLVCSISLHNHKISLSPDSHTKITAPSHAASHTADECSACLLHGNIKLTDAETVFSCIDPGQSISFNETKHLIAHSFLIKDKPSRSPPAI